MSDSRQFLIAWATMKAIRDPQRQNEFRHHMTDRFPQASEAFARQRRAGMMSSPHELARAALEAAIQAGRVAHHSGAADDLYRKADRRLRELAGLPRYGSQGYTVPVELHDTTDGRIRAIVDTCRPVTGIR